MNLDELRSVQAKERRKDSLQHLRDDFYDDVAAYVADLRAARDGRAEQVAKPFSDDDVRRMSDELETAEEVGKALYERRVGKVVKLASFAAADMSVDTEGMTSQERALFDDLVERIEAKKSHVLDALAGEGPVEPNEEATPTGDPATNDPAADGVEAPAPGSDPDPNADVLAGAMGGDRDGASGADGTDTRSEDPADDPVPVEQSDPETGEQSDPVSGERSDPATTDGGATPAEHDPASAERDPPFAPTSGGDTDDAAVDRETVRITSDVGAILGVDEREYELASEDVVTLPAENAEPLVRRDAAERVE